MLQKKQCVQCAWAIFVQGSKLQGIADRWECRANPPTMTCTPIMNQQGSIMGQVNTTAYPVVGEVPACRLFSEGKGNADNQIN